MKPTMNSPRRGIAPTLLLATLAALALPAQAKGEPRELVLHAGRPMSSLQVTVAAFEGPEQVLKGDSVVVPKPENPRVPDSVVGARVSGKNGRRDALTLHWKGAWFASLRFVAAQPMDLRPYLPDGTVEFDVNAVDLAKAGLTFAMGCGKGCGRKLPYVLPSRELQGKGWQHLSFSLQCFARDGNDFSAVTQPFVVDSSGTGEVAVANVKIVPNGKPNASCPDYRTESVTPTPLNQVWALEWWVPRHEKKLEEVRKLKAVGLDPEVIFIGDSITQGWEDQGKDAWAQHYARYNALNLGFGGDHTENALWRLQHGELDGIAPKVAVMMIGTNNTGDRQEDPRTTAAGVKRLLEEVRTRLPNTKVLLLAVFPRGEKADDPMRRLNDRVNGLISGYADDRNVHFLNINEALTNPDGTLSKDVMFDLLHLTEKGYALWVQSMQPTLQKLLSQQP